MKNEDGLSDFMKFAYKCNKVRDVKEAFEEYTVENEWHKGKIIDQIEGRNSVIELLESERDINKILIAKGERHGSVNKIIALAKQRKIVIVEVERAKLNAISETNNHQGVIAIVPPFNYVSVEDILNEAKNKKEDPFILILDGIEDPHNLGSIIRTAETAGVHGVIIPKRRACRSKCYSFKSICRSSRTRKNCKGK